jgi:flagellin-like protein
MVVMKTPYINKKGVSPIIATLLLIVIAVAAAVVTYSFVMGITGTTTGTTIAQGQLTYDVYKVDKTGGNNYLLTAYIRNSGGKSVILNSIYLAGSAYTYNGSANSSDIPSGNWAFYVGTSNTATLGVGEVGILYVNTTANLAQWTPVRIVCTDGTVLEFSVRKS